MTKLTGKLFDFTKPNKNGNLYSKDAVKKALEEFVLKNSNIEINHCCDNTEITITVNNKSNENKSKN